MKKTKVVTKLIAIILSILVVVQVAPMSTFAETIETESEKFEESGYSTEVSQEEEDPIVIGEDVDRRDSSNTKYFKMSDGTIKAAVYKDPVLYQDSAGKWQEIDNTLETSDNENDELSNFNGYAIQRHQTVHIFLKIGTDILPMLPIPLIMLIRRIPDMHSDSAALQRFLRK